MNKKLKLNCIFKDGPIGIKLIRKFVNTKGIKESIPIPQQNRDNLVQIIYRPDQFDYQLSDDDKNEIDDCVVDLFETYAILNNVNEIREKLVMNSEFDNDKRLYLTFDFSTDTIDEETYGLNSLLRFLRNICDTSSITYCSNWFKYKYLCDKMSKYLNKMILGKDIKNFFKEKEFCYVRSVEFLDLKYGDDGYDLDKDDFRMRICIVGAKVEEE